MLLKGYIAVNSFMQLLFGVKYNLYFFGKGKFDNDWLLYVFTSLKVGQIGKTETNIGWKLSIALVSDSCCWAPNFPNLIQQQSVLNLTESWWYSEEMIKHILQALFTETDLVNLILTTIQSTWPSAHECRVQWLYNT